MVSRIPCSNSLHPKPPAPCLAPLAGTRSIPNDSIFIWCVSTGHPFVPRWFLPDSNGPAGSLEQPGAIAFAGNSGMLSSMLISLS